MQLYGDEEFNGKLYFLLEFRSGGPVSSAMFFQPFKFEHFNSKPMANMAMEQLPSRSFGAKMRTWPVVGGDCVTGVSGLTIFVPQWCLFERRIDCREEHYHGETACGIASAMHFASYRLPR